MAILTRRYQERRQRLTTLTGNKPMLIHSGGVAPDPWLWDKNLTYLTGLNDQEAYLLIVPDGVNVEHFKTLNGPELGRGHRVHEILFVEQRSEHAVFMDGPSPAHEQIREEAGVDRVYSLNKLHDILQRVLLFANTLWLNTPATPQLGKRLTADLEFIKGIRERFYWVTLKNAAPLIHQMRFVKDRDEVAALRRAFEIQTAIFTKIMQALKPGENESLGEAIFNYEVGCYGTEVGSLGAERYDKSIIVGAGAHTAIPHYMNNDTRIADGDLVLIDAGVTVDGYSADITRTFPANGVFTERQRELYAIVLEAQQAAIATMKPGSNLLAAHQAAYDVFAKYDVAQYGYGNCGHPVGLTIHDPHGRYYDDRERGFEPGVVVVIEPFLVLPDEGIGIRVEDGVLITEDGHEVLAGPPREIDAVEALVRASG